MICSTCGALLPSDAQPCPSCGEDPRPRCPRCRHRCPRDARFCSHCGAAVGVTRLSDHLGAPGPAALEPNERKLVTVLFADVVNSTGLAEALDPEDYHAGLTALFRQLAATLRDHGAYVEKYVGDSVMAVFGAPTTREDDAARALRASLALFDIVGQVAADQTARLGRRLDLRVGVNSGLVIAGRVGEGRAMDYGVLGEVVNLAARFQEMAGPGQTVVGETTRSLVGDGFEFEALAPFQVQGKSRPVHGFVLRGEPGDASAPRTLVGRRAELDVLREAAEAVRAGERIGVAVVGDPGTGKSILLDVARREAARTPVNWVRLACWSHLRNQPLGAIGLLIRERGPAVFRPSRRSDRGRLVSALDTCRALATLAGLAEDPWAAAVVDAVGGFNAGLAAKLDRLSAEQRRDVVVERVARVLDTLLGAPTVLVLDDAHWLDELSVMVLRDVFERRETSGALGCVATFGPEGTSPIEPDVVIPLGPVPREAAEDLIQSALGARDPALVLADDLWRASNGNPRLLIELARTGSNDRGAERELPPSLQALLLARLDRLPDQARRLARVAAVAGLEVESDAIQALLGDEGVDVPSGFAVLDAAGVVAPLPDGGYRFQVPLFAEAARSSLLLTERRRYHRLYAEWLQLHRPSEIGPIAYHFLAAEDARAVELLRQAGDRCRARGDSDAAVASYREALACLERGVGEVRAFFPTRLDLIEALASLGHLTDAFAALDAPLADVIGGDPGDDARAELLTVRAQLLIWLGEVDEARARLREAESTLVRRGASTTSSARRALARLRAIEVELLVEERRWDDAITAERRVRDAIDLLDETEPLTSRLRRRCDLAVARALAETGRVAAAEERLGPEPPEPGDDPEERLVRAVLALKREDRDQGIERANRAAEVARRRGDRRGEAMVQEYLAQVFARDGEAERAEECLRGAEDAYARIGHWRAVERCEKLSRTLGARGESGPPQSSEGP